MAREGWRWEREDVGTALLLQGLGVDGQETSQPCILLLASSWLEKQPGVGD